MTQPLPLSVGVVVLYLVMGKPGNPLALGARDHWFESSLPDEAAVRVRIPVGDSVHQWCNGSTPPCAMQALLAKRLPCKQRSRVRFLGVDQGINFIVV